MDFRRQRRNGDTIAKAGDRDRDDVQLSGDQGSEDVREKE